mmetsp:Transcript_42977/g.85122  ORF Transcript_42977/g.85122 Transcript_42977/m.85122 type:complete len:101 (+) Transcript_42977:304-606(+)
MVSAMHVFTYSHSSNRSCLDQHRLDKIEPGSWHSSGKSCEDSGLIRTAASMFAGQAKYELEPKQLMIACMRGAKTECLVFCIVLPLLQQRGANFGTRPAA